METLRMHCPSVAKVMLLPRTLASLVVLPGKEQMPRSPLCKKSVLLQQKISRAPRRLKTVLTFLRPSSEKLIELVTVVVSRSLKSTARSVKPEDSAEETTRIVQAMARRKPMLLLRKRSFNI
jgi:hypothetical protein